MFTVLLALMKSLVALVEGSLNLLVHVHADNFGGKNVGNFTLQSSLPHIFLAKNDCVFAYTFENMTSSY